MTAAHQCASFSACDYPLHHCSDLCCCGLDVAIFATARNLAGDFRNLPERHDDLAGDGYPAFHRDRGALQECPVRIVYVLLGAIDIPVLQLTLGSFLAGIMSRRQKRAEVTSQTTPLTGMGHSTAENSSTSMTRPSDDA